MTDPQAPFTAVVLAADRGSPDPVARAADVSCKAMAPVEGHPMVVRVIRALQRAKTVGTIILCGPPRAIFEGEAALQAFLEAEGIPWRPNRETPSTSAAAALKTLSPDAPVLITTADHALLTPDIVDDFCGRALASGESVPVIQNSRLAPGGSCLASCPFRIMDRNCRLQIPWSIGNGTIQAPLFALANTSPACVSRRTIGETFRWYPRRISAIC